MTNKNQTPPKIPPLIPLEYCSPERAAKLLGCDVEDIFHWVATEAIKLFAEFSLYKVDNLDVDFFSDHEWYEDFSNNEGVYFSFNGPSVSGEKPYSPCIHRFEPDDSSKEHESYISGLWHLEYDLNSATYVQSRIKEETPYNLTIVFQEYNDSVPFKQYATLHHVLVSDMPDRLRIRRDDILKIQKHIISGEVMKRTSNRPMPEKKSPPADIGPHPTAERKAATRERVWAAAIYAREQWPDDCKTASAWASTIDNHSLKLFDADKAPLSQEIMARMLGKAMKEGIPYKKS